MKLTLPIRWGILSAGNIAGTFASALSVTEGSTLQAVAARDGERADAFAKEHGASRAFDNYEALLADPEVDAVYIATLHPFHLEWILKAVAAGKHVLCEKPMTMNLREAKLAHKAAVENRCLLREAFMYRHHPQTQQVVSWVESGEIGKVRLIETSFCFNSGIQPESRHQAKELGGGAILDLGCYPMSFARLIAGRANQRLFAEPLELHAVGHLDPKTRTDMWTTAVARFEGDIIANITAAMRVDRSKETLILGEKGQISVAVPWFAQDGAVLRRSDGSEERYEPERDRNLYGYEIASFASELSGKPIGPREVGMRIDDTLGNMKALDWWRSEIGLSYPADQVGPYGSTPS